jgi:hypothetical protein
MRGSVSLTGVTAVSSASPEAAADETVWRGAPRARSGASRLGLAALRDAGKVVASAARIFLRHWPVLFALVFAGMAGRELVMTLAVKASAVHGILGFLIIVLAPIATLSALILSLRAVRPSLPWLSQATEPGRGRLGLLHQLGSVLVPFLAVYASYGYLEQDVSQYAYRVFEATVFGPGGVFDGGHPDVTKRLPFDAKLVAVAVILVAFALRWLLSRFQRGDKRRWLGVFGAYVEVIWIVMFGGLVNQASKTFLNWAHERRVVSWAEGTGTDLVRSLGPLTHAGERLFGWLWTLITSVDAVIVVPVAWLAVGAVVYGRRLAENEHERDADASPVSPAPPVSPASPVSRGVAGPNDLTQEQQRITDEPAYPVPAPPRAPGPLRRTGHAFGKDLRGRFLPLLQGIRLLVRAGLRPMLLFCLVFLLVQTTSKWLWEAERLIVGPQDLSQVWMPLSRLLSSFNDAAGQVLLACLLAAAVDRVLATQDGGGPDNSEAPPTSDGSGPAGSESTESGAGGAGPTGSGPAGSGPTGSGPGGDGGGQPPRENPSWNQPTVNLA